MNIRRGIAVVCGLMVCLGCGFASPVFVARALDTAVPVKALGVGELLPAPVHVVEGKSGWTPDFSAFLNSHGSPAFPKAHETLVSALREQGYADSSREKHLGMRVEWFKQKIDGAPLRVMNQAYQIELKPGLLRITASDEAGAFYAVQTLRQLLPAEGGEMRDVIIKDWPAFSYRGFMHDTGRNYQEIGLIKKQIEIFARYKLNVFHFHFTDNPGWRIESKRHPELQSKQSFSRHHGKFYSQQDFRELVEFAKQRHVLVIPELDVPGHSAAFRRAYGIDKMDSPGVRERLVDLVDELCGLVPASAMPFIHLGTDEVKPHERVPHEWLEACAATAHRNGRKVIGWNPGIRLTGNGDFVQQLWTEGSRPWPGRPYFDSQSNFYLNHVDPFEMLPAMTYQQPCRWGENEMKLGPIACVWHDDHARGGNDVLLMNHVLPGLLLFSDNAWRGRPTDEPDWWCRLPQAESPLFARAVALEKRLLAQRDRCFAEEPFPYLRQTDLEWRFLGPFDHGGNPAAVFPPESEGIRPGYQIGGKTVTWWRDVVRGATHYPNHFWYRSHLKQRSGTIYAFTRIWSPEDQDVGAWIGFNAWSRSSGRRRGGPTPEAGEWNRSHAAVWLNGMAVAAPEWRQSGIGGIESEEIPLVDEDYFYRPPTPIRLQKGWNDVLVKAPHKDAWKWVFTFIPVQSTGKGFNVREVPGLRYDANFDGQEAEEFRRLLAEVDSPLPEALDDAFGPACSFSNGPSGALRRYSSTHGIWTAEMGHASLIEPAANRRLLKIEGGMQRVIQLELPDVETIDGMSFFLRRWTRNDPFDLSIEAQADGEWKLLGRLLTADMNGRTETLEFPVVQVKALRFTSKSPAHGGLMLDSLRFRAANPSTPANSR